MRSDVSPHLRRPEPGAETSGFMTRRAI